MANDEAKLELDVGEEPPTKKSKLVEEDLQCSNESVDNILASSEQETAPIHPSNNSAEKGSDNVSSFLECPADTSTKANTPTASDTAENNLDSPAQDSSISTLPSPDKVPSTPTTKRPATSPTKSKKKRKKKKKLKSPSSEDTATPASANRKAANLRKNIKDILQTQSLGEETLAAQREEAERRERMNLKLQQLKLLQAQQAAVVAPPVPTLPTTPNSIPICDFESILNEGGQESYSLSVDENSGVIDTGTNYYQSPHLDPVEPSADGVLQEIVLSSDDDEPASSVSASSSTNTFPALHPSRFQVLSELRSHLSHPPRFILPNRYLSHNSGNGAIPSNNISTFSGLPKSEDQNVISISSGDEEDNDNCDREVRDATSNNRNGFLPTPYFNNNSQMLSMEKTPRSASNGNNDSDDDCVVLSPTPESNDVDKDEKNLDELNVHDSEGRVLVNVGHPDEDPDVFLPPQVARIVKPHQIGGIRFLYDNVVESIDRFSTASGFGCILAHSMGLGKTIQAVSFCDVFLRAANAKTVLIIVPINTIQNWLNEFNVWLPTKKTLAKKKKKSKPTATNPLLKNSTNSSTTTSDALISETMSLNLSFDSTLNFLEGEGENNEDTESKTEEMKPESEELEEDVGEVHLRSFEVYVLNETVKTLQAREKIIAEWSSKGGVMLIGYEMYRMLALKKLKKSKKLPNMSNFFEGSNYGDDLSNEATSLNNIHACLVDPGPNLVICDEGHRIKNSGASISQALKAIRTRRRVVLTGYPLQNNLIEYWCMVDFIRPNYLGSKVEFSNMFERPISNGQCVDSTPEDRKLMRFRSHVLHSLLEGFVQRRSHAVLHSALPPKQEHVFLLKMTTVQYNLYKEFMAYLSNNVDGQCGANPIKAFAVCCKIWNHPDALYNVVKRKQSILDDLDLDEVNGNGGSTGSRLPSRRGRGGRKDKQEGGGSPQISFFDGSGFDFRKNMSTSPSTSFSTTKSGSEGLSLDWALPIFENYVPGVLENGVKFEILFEIIRETVVVKDKLLVFSQTLLSLDLVEFFLQQKFNWTKNAQYYRLDGSTTGLEREKLINNFNSVEGVFVFLVSTRAGSLGINLIGANRVVVLDASWNPCHDCQAVCRIYRYGQTKPCQIYRFVSDCTLEKRIYDRQINKRGMSDRVVDEMNPNAQFKSKDVSSFLVLKHDHLDKLQHIKCDLDPEKYSDTILQNVLRRQGDKLTQAPFEHESLLIDQKSQRLSATEKRLAHRNYLSEKKTSELQSASGYSYSRPSYAAYYPKGDSSSSAASSLSNLSSQRPSFLNHTASAPASLSSFRSSASYSHEDKFERHVPTLRAKGICVQSIVLKKDSFLADPSGGPDMYLMAGEKIYVLRSDKGTYLRISNGKLIAVRNTPSNSRFPCLNVPSTQELAKEQLQTLVYSFLKLPSHSSYGDYGSSGFSSRTSSYSGIHPTEQPLPPSASFFSQNKNHLQITNTRSNSGGDVTMNTMWQPPQSPTLVGSSSCNNKHQTTDFSKPQSLNALLDSSNGAGFGMGFNSSLEKLSYLARFSGISSQRKDADCMRRTRVTNTNDDSNSSNSNSAFPTGFIFPHKNPSIINKPFSPGGSTPLCPSADLELIPISKKKNGGASSDSNSHQISPSYLYSPSVSISTTRSVEVDEPHQKSNDAANPSFYEDFTITVKSPTNNSSPNNSTKTGNKIFVPTPTRPGHHFNFDRGEYLPVVDQPSNSNPSSNNLYSGTSSVTDFANFNQYYNNNGPAELPPPSPNHESFPFYPNQDV